MQCLTESQNGSGWKGPWRLSSADPLPWAGMPPSRSGCLSPGLLLPSSPGPFHTSSPRQQPEEAVRSGHAAGLSSLPPSWAPHHSPAAPSPSAHGIGTNQHCSRSLPRPGLGRGAFLPQPSCTACLLCHRNFGSCITQFSYLLELLVFACFSRMLKDYIHWCLWG